MEELFEIAGNEYYFDLDSISNYIRIDDSMSVDLLLSKDDEENNQSINNENLQMIDVSKWEVIKVLIETVLNENGIIDESMGIKKLEKELSIPFRLSFNTLLKHKLIRKNG